MDEHHQEALNKALTWINGNFRPVAVIITGSIVRGNPNLSSDIDIYVIHTEDFRQRIQKYFNNIPCEIFVNNFKHVYNYFEDDHNDNRPITAHMISTGKVIKGEHDTEFKKLLQTANDYLLRTHSFTDQNKIRLKYMIATLFEDATDVKNTDILTSCYFLNKLVNDIIDYTFLSNGVQLPRPKERIKYLEMNFPEIHELISNYFKAENFNNKYETAKILVGRTTGEFGFFEWDSGKE